MSELLVSFGSPLLTRINEVAKVQFYLTHEVVTTSRLDYNPDLYRFELKSERVKDLPECRATFDELCDARALELEKIPSAVYLMWSGGIDSSTALVSILKNWHPDSLKKLVILMSGFSYREFPELFKIAARTNARFISSNVELEQFTYDGTVVTGELADQLFGSDICSKAIATLGSEDVIHDNWKKTLLAMTSSLPVESKKFVEHLEPITYEAPFPIKTFFDFAWWWNFTQKWQHVKYRLLLWGVWSDRVKSSPYLTHFFDTPDFQGWSLANHHLKVQGPWKTYKLPAKRYIVDYTKCERYLDKPKVGSLVNTALFKERTLGLTTDMQTLNRHELLRYANDLRVR